MEETIIGQIVKATGLPVKAVQQQLDAWCLQTGKSPQGLTLEDLRDVLVTILQDLFAEVAEGQNDHVSLSDSDAPQ